MTGAAVGARLRVGVGRAREREEPAGVDGDRPDRRERDRSSLQRSPERISRLTVRDEANG